MCFHARRRSKRRLVVYVKERWLLAVVVSQRGESVPRNSHSFPSSLIPPRVLNAHLAAISVGNGLVVADGCLTGQATAHSRRALRELVLHGAHGSRHVGGDVFSTPE
jgi:hypothetical protein